eukprot:gnl/TRDRNA2_/TRDRNA2_183677_c0_seq1.p1 gnl/TRDRNA2_/TRDRNA2_183677_c0~~gnl/TRDRNA2_/TRDRNA2_183677_c0_seq1.p1  ORF type:complete len:115 (-),score=30.08 gnl/TRDRNA2_/TRDRNA2_183677_c0_seq1:71-415(-)
MAFRSIVILALLTVAFGEDPSASHVLMPPQDHDVNTRKQIVQHFLAQHNQRVADEWAHKQDIQAAEDAKKTDHARNALAAADASMNAAKEALEKTSEEVRQFKAQRCRAAGGEC